MNIEQEFSEYIDSSGLISYAKGVDSGNGLLYTAISLIILQDNNALSEGFKRKLYKAMTACQVMLGLFNRSPTNKDLEAPDDYVGIAATSVVGLHFAESVLVFGKKHFYNYNNVSPGAFSLKTWMGRQLQLIAHFHYASGIKPNILLRVYWCLSLVFASRATRDDQDAWMLSWLLVRTIRGNWIAFGGYDKYVSTIECMAITYWYKQLHVLFPDGMRDVNYISGHPINKYIID